MTLSEKSAYLKGLMDGLKLNEESSEGKMIVKIVDLLQDVAKAITDLEENAIAVSDELVGGSSSQFCGGYPCSVALLPLAEASVWRHV